MKKLLSCLLILSLACTMFTGFAFADASVYTDEMVERSLFSVGNTQRLHRVIDKAQNGEPVSIVYLGGSITEGASAVPQTTNCYAALSAKAFAEKFMPDPSLLKYRNSGISGTPSLLGVTRCEQDVLSYEPDIVFIEYAVNDGTDDRSRMAYESLVRKVLNSETQPVVILLFTLTDTGYSAHVHMKQVGKHYDLGMISVYDAVQVQIMLGKMQWSDYSADFAHPTTDGHAFIARLIGHYFDVAAETAPSGDYVIPQEAHYGNQLEGLVNIRKMGDPAVVSVGTFPSGVAMCYSYAMGWKHSAGSAANNPLTFHVTGTHMTIVFKQENNPDCGVAEVWVDGEYYVKLPGHSSSAWGQPVTEMILLGENGPHTVEIKMAEGDELKAFTVLDAAYAAN